jgi:hypothetical protein
MILPPPSTSGQRLRKAPLWDWKRVDEFDSESACRQALAKLIEDMPNSGMDTARCVPDDYLKGQHIPEKVGEGPEYQEFDFVAAHVATQRDEGARYR